MITGSSSGIGSAVAAFADLGARVVNSVSSVAEGEQRGQAAHSRDRQGRTRPNRLAARSQHQDAATKLLRIAVHGTLQAAGRAFWSQMVELPLSSCPDLYASVRRNPGRHSASTGPALLEPATLEHTVHNHDGTTETIVRGTAPDTEPAVRGAPDSTGATSASTPWCNELVAVSLGDVSQSHSARSCMPDPATRAATPTSGLGTRRSASRHPQTRR